MMKPRCNCDRLPETHNFNINSCGMPLPKSDEYAEPRRAAITHPLSTPALLEIVKEIQYKPGWHFAVEMYDDLSGPYLVIRAKTTNAYDHNASTVLCIRSMIPPMGTRAAFLEWILWRLTQAEIHETQEFFHVDGRPYLDPHRELGP